MWVKMGDVCCVPFEPNHASKIFIKTGEYGLHAKASQNISAGTVILQCLPLAHSLLTPPGTEAGDADDVRRRRCSLCFFRGGDDGDTDAPRMNGLKRCSKCKVAYYCSRSCQAQDWIGHKLECQYYVKRKKTSSSNVIATSAEEDAIPLLLRTFAALKQLQNKDCEESIDNTISCGGKHFSSLSVSPEYHDESHLHSIKTAINSTMYLAKECMTSNVEGKSDDSAASILGYGFSLDNSIQRALNAFQKNNFGIVDSLHASIGEGVYPCAALLNHSCNPNCILRYDLGSRQSDCSTTYNPPILQIVACRDIKKDEELTHSYVDLALPTPERKSRLLETHGFECCCARCANQITCQLPKRTVDWALWPIRQKMRPTMKCEMISVSLDDVITCGGSREDYSHLIQQSQFLQDQAHRCMLEGDSRGELSNLQRAISLFDHGISPFDFNLYSIRCSFLAALLASGDILSAVEQCEHIASFLAVSFSHVQNHPLLGLQLYTLGDLYSAAAESEGRDESFNLSLEQKASVVYTWARNIMRLTHGERNAMVQTLDHNLSR